MIEIIPLLIKIFDIVKCFFVRDYTLWNM